MKVFIVSFGSRIVGSYDYTYVMANNSQEALEKGKSMLNTNKLSPDFLNSYGCFNVREV